MSKKIITLSILLFIISAFVFPEHIDFAEASAIAFNWAGVLRSEFREEISLQPGGFRIITRNGIDTAYVFDFDEKGFLVIPARDYLAPIKFYTTSFDFGESEAAQKFQDAVFSELEAGGARSLRGHAPRAAVLSVSQSAG
jgi:hypothetical protein